MRTIRDVLFDGGIRTVSEVLSKEDEDDSDDFSEELEETNFSIDSEAAEAQTKTQAAMTREIINLQDQIRVSSWIQIILTASIVIFSAIQVAVRLNWL